VGRQKSKLPSDALTHGPSVDLVPNFLFLLPPPPTGESVEVGKVGFPSGGGSIDEEHEDRCWLMHSVSLRPLPLANSPPSPPAVSSSGERSEVRLGPSCVVPICDPEGHQQRRHGLSFDEASVSAMDFVIRRSLVRAQFESVSGSKRLGRWPRRFFLGWLVGIRRY